MEYIIDPQALNSQRRDRFNISTLMRIWVDNKNEWRKNPIDNVNIHGHHFTIKAEHSHQCLKISCDKFTWTEDYSPVYVTARFSGCGSRS